MGRTKSRPRPVVKKRKFLGLPVQKHKLEKRNILKLCVTKLARIEDPQAKLCKAVLINNTLRNLQRQPECVFPEVDHCEEVNKQEVEANNEFDNSNNKLTTPSIEYMCSHLDSSSRLHSESSERKTCESLATDTMSLCDDIINEFLGVSDCHASEHSSEPSDNQDIYEKLIKSHSWMDQSDDNKENLSENVDIQGDVKKADTLHQFGGSPVSPYSYSSFLSEVYRVTIRKIKHKVQL
eukprot:GFUD01019142.1.p1 GENE.GFUD01019142.1~~GFUD01019142.1.p1  ORF type:complete len:237 (+),score=42.04 GFUD01019142.1:160-870(+)